MDVRGNREIQVEPMKVICTAWCGRKETDVLYSIHISNVHIYECKDVN